MAYFAELDEYLNRSFLVDAWEDEAIDYAINVVRQLSTEDWMQLRSVWSERPAQWQTRCAQILSWGDTQFSVDILIQMLYAPDTDVAVTAADSLREIDHETLVKHVTPEAKTQLEALAQSQQGINARVTNDLLKRL